jgi:hypothetical protein
MEQEDLLLLLKIQMKGEKIEHVNHFKIKTST